MAPLDLPVNHLAGVSNRHVAPGRAICLGGSWPDVVPQRLRMVNVNGVDASWIQCQACLVEGHALSWPDLIPKTYPHGDGKRRGRDPPGRASLQTTRRSVVLAWSRDRTRKTCPGRRADVSCVSSEPEEVDVFPQNA